MSDSPAEDKDSAAGSSPAQKASPKIPKARLDEALSQKRELQAELEQIKQQHPAFDMEALTKHMTEVAIAAAEAATAPFKQKAEVAEMGMRLGLRDPKQLEVVADYKQKGLSEEDAMLLARSKHRDLFPTSPQPWNARTAGLVPPGGASALRSEETPRVDRMSQIREIMASDAPDRNIRAQKVAYEELHERVQRARMNP